MCFGGGGGGGSAPAPQIFNAQPVSKQFEVPKPPKLDRQYRSLVSEATTPSIRLAGKKAQTAGLTPLRRKLSPTQGMASGVTIAGIGGMSPPGGVNL